MPGSVSIKDEIAGESEEEELVETFDKDSEEFKNAKPISQEDLQKVWTEYAASVVKDKPDLGSTLASGVPEIGKDFTLEFEVKNSIQKDKIDHFRQEMVPVLREKLRHKYINLNVIVNPDKVEERKPVTPTEKFSQLAGKNPALIELQKKFGLEPNY